jgi:hypothetical protein
MTTGGYFFTYELRDYCIPNVNNPYECIRITDKTDPKYNNDIYPTALLNTFTDSNTGEYSTEFTIPKIGHLTFYVYQVISKKNKKIFLKIKIKLKSK